MSYWIYHEIWAKDNHEFNLIEKLQEAGALTNVHESEDSYSPERIGTLNLEKIAPKEVEMERERVRKFEEEHHRTVSEEDLRRIGTAITVSFRGEAAGDLRSDHEEAGLEFISHYVPNIDYLFGISKKYPDITFNFRIITENGRNLADGYVKNGKHVTNMGKPYGNVFIFKKAAAKFSRDTDEVAINVPILENGEEKSSFVTINAKKEDLLEAIDFGFHDRNNYDRYYAIPFPNADDTITYSKYGEQKTVGVTEFRKMHYEARLKYAKEKSIIEFPVEVRDLYQKKWNGTDLIKLLMDVPTTVSDNGKMSILFNLWDFNLEREGLPISGTVLFHSENNYEKNVSVKKGATFEKIGMNLSDIKKLYQEFQKERMESQLQSEESRMMEEEQER
jgi:hypothetical protein